MRTTLEIEDDVLMAAKELAQSEGSSAGKVISRLVRKALIGDHVDKDVVEYRNGVPLLPRRGVIVTNDFVNRLREEEGT